MIVNNQTLAGINTSFNTLFNNAFADGVAQGDYNRVAMMAPSSSKQNDYAWMGKIPSLREWLGDRQIHAIEGFGHTIVNKKYEVTIGVGRDEIDDDQIGQYSPIVSEIGRAASDHPNEMIFPLLSGGFSANGYDGQNFFDTDHPVLDANGVSQSVSNFGGGAGTAWYLLDTTRAVKPFIWQTRRPYEFKSLTDLTSERVFLTDNFLWGVDARVNAGYGLWQLAYGSKQPLNTANYAAARTAMMAMTGDHGRKLGLHPKLLVAGPSLEKAAFEVLKNERDAAGATNTYQNSAELMITPWLA